MQTEWNQRHVARGEKVMTRNEAISHIITIAAELCREPIEDFERLPDDSLASDINSRLCEKARRLKKVADSLRDI